jgi:hypothetical protein
VEELPENTSFRLPQRMTEGFGMEPGPEESELGDFLGSLLEDELWSRLLNPESTFTRCGSRKTDVESGTHVLPLEA